MVQTNRVDRYHRTKNSSKKLRISGILVLILYSHQSYQNLIIPVILKILNCLMMNFLKHRNVQKQNMIYLINFKLYKINEQQHKSPILYSMICRVTYLEVYAKIFIIKLPAFLMEEYCYFLSFFYFLCKL
jgi:hypothetical protein